MPFSQFSSTPSGGDSLIGSTPAPAGGFSAFGSAPAPASGFSAFGSAPAPADGFSLIGSTPAPAGGFSAFGSAPAPASGFSAFGSAPALADGFSLIGSTPAPAGGFSAFGSTPAPASGFSAFGSAPAPAPAGGFSLFGSTPAPFRTQFCLGSFTENNGTSSSKDRIIKHSKESRKHRPSSMEPATSASTTSAISLSFLATDQSSTNSCKPNAKSGHENIEPEVAEKQSKTTSEVREAIQEHVKNSSLMVISRILKGIPQNPHFHKLRHHSELARKSMISAWDWVFEETVEQIHFLQGNDFWVRARELWKTMEELQTMGYNVIPLRRRLVELSDVMIQLKLSKLEMKGLKIKAENHRAEKSRLEFIIMNLQEMINKEQESMENAISQVAEMEKGLPKLDGAFTKLAMEPF